MTGAIKNESDNRGASTGERSDTDGGNGGNAGGDGSDRDQGVLRIHGSIVQSICRIKCSMEAVKKGTKNVHGGYMFASTDDIYASLARKMGEVGLVILSCEDECVLNRVENKEGKIVQWVKLTFSFVLATEKATWSDPRARRTLYIQVTGPQTFQAAQSYAEKAYLRSLFKLPTGDMDLDSLAQADTEEAQISVVQPTRRKSSSGAKKDGTTATFNEIRRDIAGANCCEHLVHIRNEVWASEWSVMPTAWATILDNEYEDRMDQFAITKAE